MARQLQHGPLVFLHLMLLSNFYLHYNTIPFTLAQAIYPPKTGYYHHYFWLYVALRSLPKDLLLLDTLLVRSNVTLVE